MTFVGGNANAIALSALLPVGDLIGVNTNGAFFNALAPGTSIAASNDFAAQYAAINGDSDQARVFILLHELALVFGMIRRDDGGPDPQSQANQRSNNDQIWRDCSSVIQSFSNHPY